MQYIDLHVHSNISDGTLTPSEVVEQAYQLKLAAIALTDHDTVAGIAEAKTAARRLSTPDYSLRVISGVEISSAYLDRDIHILGLMIDETNPELLLTLNEARIERNARNDKMVSLFRNQGIELTIEDLLPRDSNSDTSITRAHFARFLVEHKYVKSSDEAFHKYLGYDCPCYVNRTYMTLETAIMIIKKAGGIPILAHPLLYKLNPDELTTLIIHLKNLGLKGIEAIYSANIGLEEGIVRSLAHRHNLLITGGSDFHGANKTQISLGTGRGNLKIPISILEELENSLDS